MRLAFVDLAFGWPPPGGAQADLYNTMCGLQALGHEVHLVATVYPQAWRFGDFNPADLPFPATRLETDARDVHRRRMPRLVRRAVEAVRPDVVFVCFGRYLKPYVVEALADYPLVSRFYMYEHLCIQGFNLWKDRKTCQNDFLRTPNTCRRCALACWSGQLMQGRDRSPYSQEFLAARTYAPGYHRVFLDALRKTRMAIVNNEMAKSRLEGYCDHVCIIPGGVHVDEIEYAPLRLRPPRDKTVILVTGRMDDPLKGLDVAVDACRGLATFRNDFELWITGNDPSLDYPWLRQLGWLDYRGILKRYTQADIAVVPSKWEEPFGIVAVEAMAAGLPVCASRVGGLQGIVRHGETGYLFEGGAPAELALYLERLLDDPESRWRMGDAGRRRAVAEYDWTGIVERYYPPLLERVLS